MLIFITNVFDKCSLPSAFHLIVHISVMGGVEGQPTRIRIYIPSRSCPAHAGKKRRLMRASRFQHSLLKHPLFEHKLFEHQLYAPTKYRMSSVLYIPIYSYIWKTVLYIPTFGRQSYIFLDFRVSKKC